MPAPPTPPPGAPSDRLTVEQQAVLRHPVRRKAFETIQAEPGIAVNDLGALLGLSWSMLAFHLRVLSRVGLVIFRSTEGRRRIYPSPGGARRLESPPATLLRDEGTRAVAAEIVREPGRRLSELAAALDGSPCAAHHHLRRLRKWGLVKQEGASGGTPRIAPADDLARLLR